MAHLKSQSAHGCRLLTLHSSLFTEVIVGRGRQLAGLGVLRLQKVCAHAKSPLLMQKTV